MNGRIFVLCAGLALGAGPFVVPAPLAAQCRLCAVPTTDLPSADSSQPIRLEVQARLDFDQIILLDAGGGGSARLMPDGSSSVSGSVGRMTGRAMVGSVAIRGEPGRLVRIDLPSTIELHGLTGSTIRLDSLATDLPAVTRLDSQGNLQFRFGGELHVQGSVEGDYRGDVSITVDYL